MWRWSIRHRPALVLAGEKGTGKRLLAGKTWEYCKGKAGCYPAESRFAELDCHVGRSEPGGTGFAARFKRRLRLAPAAIFCTCTALTSWRTVQAEAVRFLTAVLCWSWARSIRAPDLFGATVPPSLKNSVPVQAELLPLRTRSLLEKNGSSIVF